MAYCVKAKECRNGYQLPQFIALEITLRISKQNLRVLIAELLPKL